MGLKIIFFNIEKIIIFLKEKKNNRNKGYLYESNPFSKKTKHMYPLTNKLRENNLNNITASSILYEYKIDNGDLHITIDIKGITKKIDVYKIYQREGNAEIKLEYGNYIIKDPSTNKDGDFTVFSFNFPNVHFENLKIFIKQRINNFNQISDLYFIPRNYLKNVDFIKIYNNSKTVKCFRALPNNQYEDVVSIDGSDNGYVFLNNKLDGNYVNSAFFIHDYKH